MGFREALSILAPQYSMPSRATVRKYLAAMYEAGFKMVKAALAPLREEGTKPAARGLSACLITDAWGARNGKSYNAVLATTLDDDFNSQLLCLKLSEFEKAHHTAEVLADMLKDTLSYTDYNVDARSIFRTVHDAGSNINKGSYWWVVDGSVGGHQHTSTLSLNHTHARAQQPSPMPASTPPAARRTRSSAPSSTPSRPAPRSASCSAS